MTAPITEHDIQRYMSWQIPSGTELHQRILSELLSNPNGQVAEWCVEAGRKLEARAALALEDMLATTSAKLEEDDMETTNDNVSNAAQLPPCDSYEARFNGTDSRVTELPLARVGTENTGTGDDTPGTPLAESLGRRTKTSSTFAKYRIAAGIAVGITLVIGIWRMDSGESTTSLNDSNGTIVIDARGHITGLDKVSLSLRSKCISALHSLDIPVPANVRRLAGDFSDVRSGAQTTAFPVAPSGETVIDSIPSFSWRPDVTARQYRVFVYSDNLTLFLESEPQSDTTWQVSMALTPGKTYYWEVLAQDDRGRPRHPPIDSSKTGFRVLTTAESETLSQELFHAGNSFLARAIVFAEFGALSHARGELSQLERMNPTSPLVRELAANLSRRRSNGIEN